MWRSDQAASVEVSGLIRLVQNIREIERALGDGIKLLYPSEIGQRNKLHLVNSLDPVPSSMESSMISL